MTQLKLNAQRCVSAATAVLLSSAVIVPFDMAWAQAEDGSGPVIEEIIVTAQKREQSVQDIPSTVNSTQGEALEEYKVFDFGDLKNLNPGMESRKVRGRTGTIAIRGINYNPNSGAAQAVDVYWNDTTLGALGGGGVFQQLFDIGRIEILRGPQGTLQGRTSPAGMVNIHTAKPDLAEMDGYVRTTFTDNSGNNTQFGLSVPLIEDKLAVRFAGVHDKNDLDEARNFLDGNVSSTETLGGRFSLAWDATDELSVDLAYQYLDNDLNFVLPLAGSSTLPFQPVTLPDIEPSERVGIQLQPVATDGEYENVSLNIAWDIGDHRLTFVGGYHEISSLSTRDSAEGNSNPGTPQPGFAAPETLDETDYASSQELRLNSVDPGVWDYTFGIYRGTESGQFDRFQLQSPAALPVYIPSPFELEDVGVFSHNIFNISDQLTAQLGVRWQQTDRKVDSDVISTVTVPPLGISAGDVLSDLLPNEIGYFKSTKVTGSASLSYAFTDPDLMVYGKMATSYRPGGASIVPRNLLGLATYEEEESWFAELGIKSMLWEDRLRLNGSVFYQDFDAYITRLSRIAINNAGNAARPSTSSMTTNGDAEVLGLEVFAEALLTDNWFVTASGAFTNAEFKDGTQLPCNDGNPIPDGTVANTCDAGGQALGAQPKVSMTISSDYTIPFNTSEAYVRALYNFVGEREDINAPTSEKLSSYSVFDLYLGWRLDDGRWDLSVYARNLFDTDDAINYLAEWRTRVASLPSGYRGVDLVPARVIGFSATLQF